MSIRHTLGTRDRGFITPCASVQDSGLPYTASPMTGGTITDYALNGINYRTHTFLTSANLVCYITKLIDVLIVAGGGGGEGAGGGGGGFIYMEGMEITAGTTITATVGLGGEYGVASDVPGQSPAHNGGNSSLGTATPLIAIGGGGGGGRINGGFNGGCGGGGGYWGSPSSICSPGLAISKEGYQGYNGLTGYTGWPPVNGGGAGGAGARGTGKSGGDGRTCSITGSSVYYGGGGGCKNCEGDGSPGTGGQGGGGYWSNALGRTVAGTDGLGGGGGGGGYSNGANGGSGVVIVRYIL